MNKLDKAFIVLSLIFQCVVIAGTLVVVQTKALDAVPSGIAGNVVDRPDGKVCDVRQMEALLTLAQRANNANINLLHVSRRVTEGVAWIIGGSLILQLIVAFRVWRRRN